MCYVYVPTSSLFVSLTRQLYSCLASPPELSGHFAEALRLFEQFIQKSDLQAAQQSVEICESLLADSRTNVQVQSHNAAAAASEVVSIERPLGSQTRHHVLIQLARTLEERNRYVGDARDLECAARHGGDALALCHAEDMVCPTVWAFYADILESNFEVTNDLDELSMAEMLCREALPLCAASHPLSSTIYHTVSWIAFWRFRQNGGEARINEALHLQHIALERLPETESNNRHRHLRRLAQILSQANTHVWHQKHDESLSVMSEAFRICPAAHVDRWTVHSQMTGLLCREYFHSGEPEFLIKSIEFGRQGLDEGIFFDNANRAVFLGQVAGAFRFRYEMDQVNDEDLEESVKLYREALLISPPKHTYRPFATRKLAEALVMRFCLDGDISHLEEASQLYYYADETTPIPAPERYDSVSGLAQCLSLRYKETGDISELTQAIDLEEKSMVNSSPSSYYYARSATQMVSHLCLRFEALHGNDDLKRAITVAEQLLMFLTDGDMNRLEVTNVLAKARFLHATGRNNLVGIDSAIQELLSNKDELSRSRFGPESLRTLAACYMIKFRHSLAANNALLAMEVMEEALHRANPDHHERFQCLIDA
jgi:tetratricopeptide (TPR) repeat protein